jgi:hypothetical protein
MKAIKTLELNLARIRPISVCAACRRHRRSRLGWRIVSIALGAILLQAMARPAVATNIPTSLDLDILRPAMPGEGYLHFTGGDDLTGWVDKRNPAFYDGTDGKSTTVTNTIDANGIGYDRSDFQVRVQNVIVTDKNGVKAAPTKASIESDYNYLNQIYRQLGISVISTGNIDATYNNVAFPLSNPAGVDTVLGANRPGGLTVPNYYVGSIAGGASGVGGGPSLPPSGTAIADAHNPDSLAHEVGHFLLDANRFPFPSNGNTDAFHSPNVTDLMRTGDPGRTIPNADVKSTVQSQFQRLNGAPSQPGQKVGNIGGLDQFAANVGAAGGPFNTAQIDAIFGNQSDGNAYVQRSFHPQFGDRADLTFVEDNIPLEEAAARPGSNQRMVHQPGFDFMTWGIDAAAVSPTIDQNALGHQTQAPELNLPGFNGPFFRTADIATIIARYADQDVLGSTGQWSARESALDYIVQFSADDINWFSGTPVNVFDLGWTDLSQADDFLARWDSPVDARFLRIQADTNVAEDDRNTQIDAIIVSQALIGTIDEPLSLGLFGFGTIVMILSHRRKLKAE